MSARLIDGKAIAASIRQELTEQIAAFCQSHARIPKLAAVLVGENAASQVYVRNKEQACTKAGMASDVHRLPESTTQLQLLELIAKLNASQWRGTRNLRRVCSTLGGWCDGCLPR